MACLLRWRALLDLASELTGESNVWRQRENECGPTALANALSAVHIDIDPERLVSLCGTTHEGTDEKDILKALGLLEINAICVRSYPELLGHLYQKKPVVCSVAIDEPYDHWVAAIGILGDWIVVVDSNDTRLVYTMPPAEWRKWWRGPEGYYGLAVWK